MISREQLIMKERWRDCCDCAHEIEVSSNRLCRDCLDDPARPNWEIKEEWDETQDR